VKGEKNSEISLPWQHQ